MRCRVLLITLVLLAQTTAANSHNNIKFARAQSATILFSGQYFCHWFNLQPIHSGLCLSPGMHVLNNPLFRVDLTKYASFRQSIVSFSGQESSELSSNVSFDKEKMFDQEHSLVNGLSSAFEYHMTQGQENAADAFVGGIAVPTSATIHQADGLSGYVNSSSTSTAAVGVYAQARATGSNSQVWGLNTVVQADRGVLAAKMTSLEVDVNQNSGVDSTFGQTLIQDGVNIISAGMNKPRYGLTVVSPARHSYWQMAAQFSNFETVGVRISDGSSGSTALNIVPPDDTSAAEITGKNSADERTVWRISNDGSASFSGVMIGEGSVIRRYARFNALESPAAVAPHTCAVQTFNDIAGVLRGDILIAVVKGADQSGLSVAPGRVLGANSVAVNFCNVTGRKIKPFSSETYQFVVVQ